MAFTPDEIRTQESESVRNAMFRFNDSRKIEQLEQQLAQARESEERAHENNSASIPIAGQMARKQAFLDAAEMLEGKSRKLQEQSREYARSKQYDLSNWKERVGDVLWDEAAALRLEAEKP